MTADQVLNPRSFVPKMNWLYSHALKLTSKNTACAQPAGFGQKPTFQLNTAFILLMTKTRKFQSAPALCLLGTVIAGAASTRSIPYDWFLNMLGYSILVALILAVLATVDLKNERRAPIPVALLLESLWLPSRNAEVKLGTILWAFLGMAGFVTGMLGTALLLPIFDAASG